jgi:hypothetical protein
MTVPVDWPKGQELITRELDKEIKDAGQDEIWLCHIQGNLVI